MQLNPFLTIQNGCCSQYSHSSCRIQEPFLAFFHSWEKKPCSSDNQQVPGLGSQKLSPESLLPPDAFCFLNGTTILCWHFSCILASLYSGLLRTGRNSEFPPKIVWTLDLDSLVSAVFALFWRPLPSRWLHSGFANSVGYKCLWQGHQPLLGANQWHQWAMGMQPKEHQWVENPGACAQQNHFHKVSCFWKMSPYSHAQPGCLCHVLKAASFHPPVSFWMFTFDMLSWTFVFPALFLNSFWFLLFGNNSSVTASATQVSRHCWPAIINSHFPFHHFSPF